MSPAPNHDLLSLRAHYALLRRCTTPVFAGHPFSKGAFPKARCPNLVQMCRGRPRYFPCYALFARATSLTTEIAVDETLDIDYGEDRASWDAWVTKINKALNPLNLEFAHAPDEATGKDTYAIVRGHLPMHPPTDSQLCAAGQPDWRRDSAAGDRIPPKRDSVLQGHRKPLRASLLSACFIMFVVFSLSRSCLHPTRATVSLPSLRCARSAISSRR